MPLKAPQISNADVGGGYMLDPADLMSGGEETSCLEVRMVSEPLVEMMR